jgi:hypothetical protein
MFRLLIPLLFISSVFAQSNEALIKRLSNLPLEEKVQQICLMNDNLIYLNKEQNNIDGKLPIKILEQRKDLYPHFPALKKYDNFEKNRLKIKEWI